MDGFIEKIYENCRKIDEKELLVLYDHLYPEEEGKIGVGIDGEGRSYQSAIIGTSELTPLLEKYLIFGTHESHTFGGTVAESFRNLGKVCNKLEFLLCSGSGKSEVPLMNLEELNNYVSEKNKAPINLDLITSYPDSPIGRKVRELEGNVIKLEGRENNNEKNEKYLGQGILNDIFELGVLWVLYITSEALGRKVSPDDFPEYFNENIRHIKNLKDEFKRVKKDSGYEELIEGLSDPNISLFSCGQGVSHNVAKQFNIRVNHVRQLIGCKNNFVIGESNCIPIHENSIFLGISKSGTSPKVRKYIKEAEKIGAKSYLITGAESRDEKTFSLATWLFYPAAAVFCSEMLRDLGELLVEKGIEIDENILRSIHVRDKIE